MSAYLNTEPWFHEMPNGKLKLKRVSAAFEKQFPRQYRIIYRDAKNAGKLEAVVLVKHVRAELANNSLTDAWNKVKAMFNDGRPAHVNYWADV